MANGEPTVELTLGGTDVDMFRTNSAYLSIQGIKFKPPAAASTGSYIAPNSEQAGMILNIVDCHFELNGNNDDYAIRTQTSACHLSITGTTFESTSTSGAPYPAVYDANTSTGGSTLYVDDCTFDGGATGFADAAGESWALDGSDAGANVYRVTNSDFLNGADIAARYPVLGFIAATEASGSMRVVVVPPS